MELKKGNNGADIVRLQKLLGIAPSGYFGGVTQRLVIQWQKENGYKQDGIVSNEQWLKLISEENKVGNDKVDLTKLKGVVPDRVLEALPNIFKDNVMTNIRVSHFLSQCMEETGNFSCCVENLNYSAEGLMKIFPHYFHTLEVANKYAHKPQAIANLVYANKYGNGDVSSGDGYKYRGRGDIQLTFKHWYELLGKKLGVNLVANPDLVATKYPLEAAGFFFDKEDLWKVCDKGSTIAVIKEVTKITNGGENNVDMRIANFNKVYHCLMK